jgi:3'-phosphoadenosine 5'-phosphosulfate sulfotransferase (PAPS reductase)/FAD synthetase
MNTTYPDLLTTPLIADLLHADAPVAIGVSGGKDSDVAGLETVNYLKTIGHKGPCILIHSDLGRVEHKASLPQCQRLADRLGVELVVVRRQAGDMMDRWLARWESSVKRYSALECVKVIMPWSTPAMRFCTSELKTAIICRYLVARYPCSTILNVVGLRREESETRAQAPIFAPQAKLTSKTYRTTGYNWYPILPWTEEQVIKYHQDQGFPLHDAYTIYKNSRVSCCYCVMGSWSDLVASASNPENHDVYREQVDLEILSSFSFQSGRWLADVAPHLLSASQLSGVQKSKRRAKQREQAESRIPRHLLYSRGWPTIMPTPAEAVLLSEVRRAVADIMEFSIEYTEPASILARYAELMARRPPQHQAHVTPVQHELWSLEVNA